MLCAHTVPLLLMKGADKKRNKNHFFAMGDRVTFFGQACTVDQEEEKRVAALPHTHYIIVPSLVIGTMYIPTTKLVLVVGSTDFSNFRALP